MEKDFIKLSEELVRHLGTPSSKETAVKVSLVTKSIFKEGNYEEVPGEYSAIEVRPAKGSTLYFMEALTKFVEYHRLGMWVSAEQLYEADGYTKSGISLYAHIY